MVLRGAELSAVWTGLLSRKFVCLLLEQQLKCALGESLCGSGGDLLEGSEIDVESRPVIAKSSFGDNFGPLGSEVTEFEEFFGGETGSVHRSSCLEVTTMMT